MPTSRLEAAYDLRNAVPNPHNPRTITAERKLALRAKLERFGNVGAIVVRVMADGSHRILSGHQRANELLAMDRPMAPTFIWQGSDVEAEMLALELNGHDGEWEGDQLDAALRRMLQAGEDIKTLPIQATQLDKLMKELAAGAAAGDGGAPADTPRFVIDDTAGGEWVDILDTYLPMPPRRGPVIARVLRGHAEVCLSGMNRPRKGKA